MQYFDINLTKNVQNLYYKNYVTLMRKVMRFNIHATEYLCQKEKKNEIPILAQTVYKKNF